MNLNNNKHILTSLPFPGTVKLPPLLVALAELTSAEDFSVSSVTLTECVRLCDIRLLALEEKRQWI